MSVPSNYDIDRSLTWSEVNDCVSFKKGDKRGVRLYGEKVKDLEFDSEMEAEQWLFKFFMEKEDEEENNPDFDREDFIKRKVAVAIYENYKKKARVLTNEEYEKEAAERLGISVEEYRKQLDEF